MQTLKQQIENRCTHFTGLGNDKCKCGVSYMEVKDPVARPYKIPCLKGSDISGGKCDRVEFPSAESVAEQLKDFQDMPNAIKAVMAVKAHIKRTGERFGVITCPVCGEDEFRYGQAPSNGHTRGNCKCGISWME